VGSPPDRPGGGDIPAVVRRGNQEGINLRVVWLTGCASGVEAPGKSERLIWICSDLRKFSAIKNKLKNS